MTLYEIVSIRKRATVKIAKPSDVLGLLRGHAKAETERLIVLTLNGVYEVISVHIATMGLVNKTVSHPREVFRRAILDNAVAVVVAHNHPSGVLVPSDGDKGVCKQLEGAGKIVGIHLLDFMVVVKTGFFSFRLNGLMG
jgi:DNA repair protein RadC